MYVHIHVCLHMYPYRHICTCMHTKGLSNDPASKGFAMHIPVFGEHDGGRVVCIVFYGLR